MTNCLPAGAIHVNDVSLWAHVGVLDHERLLGQEFRLDFSLWADLDEASKNDDVSASLDYSLAIRKLQALASKIECLTIEHFSDQILNCLEGLYGQVPMKVLLCKCSPPVEGFTGSVSVEMRRHFSAP